MMQSVPSISSPDVWRARYEQLRAGWLAREVTWGQALFIQQGMASWMKAWPAEVQPSVFTRTESPAPASTSVVRGDLQRQLTRELANLIVNRQQEIVA